MRFGGKEYNKQIKDAEEKKLKDNPSFKIEMAGNYTIWHYSESHNNVVKYIIKAFRGKASKPFHFYWYKNESYFLKTIEDLKKKGIEEANWKAERKAKNKGNLTEAALVAKRIKAELKSKYPDINFSVRSENFSGGDAVRISYTNFLPTKDIEKLFNKYKGGHFNGMEDIYEYYSDSKEITPEGKIVTIPTVKYLSVSRSITEDIKTAAREYIKSTFDCSNIPDYEIETGIHRLTVNMDLTNGFNLEEAKAYPYGIFR